jgi:chromosome partitioning protein
MMYKLAIVNQKGGVGKTTTAVTVAHGLAVAGFTTLLVDLDAQGNVADVLGLEKGPGLYRLLFERGFEAAVPSGRQWLDVVLGDKTTVEAKQRLAGLNFREQVLGVALERLDADYEVCVLDVAPGVDVLQINALVACDGFLVPVNLAHLAVVGAGDVLASAVGLAQYGVEAGNFLGILPTFWDRQTKESHAQLEALVEQFGEWVWPPIPRDVKAREAPAFGQTLWEYAPHCRALAGIEIEGQMRGGYVRVLGRVMREVEQ